MKKTTILILLISLLSSCYQNNSSELSKVENSLENINKLTESSFYGAWKYEDSYIGEIFIQFEKDRLVKVFYNYEGDVFLQGKWEYKDNIINLSDVGMLDKLLISDYDGNSFKIPPTPYDSLTNTNKKYIVVNRLKDAFEPIVFLFNNRERYAHSEENVSPVIEENSNYSNSGTIQKQWVNCRYCNGTGLSKCRTCNGRGQISVGNGSAFGNSPGFHMENCYKCGGRGLYDNCSRCDGRGQVQE